MLALAYKMVPPPRNPLVNQEMLDTHALEYLMKVALKVRRPCVVFSMAEA
jgi:hypothetical protein